MKKSISTFIVFFILQSFTFLSFGQIAIKNVNEIAKVKNGTTYIAMNNSESEKKRICQRFKGELEHLKN